MTIDSCPWALLERAWQRSDRLFACVRPEHRYDRPIDLRHRLAFYTGHLPAFAANMLLADKARARSSQPRLDALFAFGIDPDEGDPGVAVELELPEYQQILDYRDDLRAELRDRREEIVASGGSESSPDGRRMVQMVLEHELMHHETLLYLLQELPIAAKIAEPLPAAVTAAVTGASARTPEVIEVGSGEIVLGTEHDERGFVWDNELGERSVRVPRFGLTDTPVTIGEYLEFVEGDGYAREGVWSEAGWRWRVRHDLARPKDWRPDDRGWRVRSLFADHAIETVLGWPVCVSWAEADAFARWKGGRLPTEAELHRAAYSSPTGAHSEYPWGDDPPADGAFALRIASPLPVGSHPENDSAWGIAELVGNGWEWTSTTFAPHPGFKPYVEAYRGYSADFFDDNHYVVFGGSWATAERLLRRSFRNWYRYNYPYPFTKFRVAFDT